MLVGHARGHEQQGPKAEGNITAVGVHGAIRLVLVLIGLVVTVATAGLAALVSALSSAPASDGGWVALVLVGMVALVITALIERKHFWATLVPLAFVIAIACGYFAAGGFFGGPHATTPGLSILPA
jgi:hypothetical protein